MPKRKTAAAKVRKTATKDLPTVVRGALKWLELKSTGRDRDNLVRFAINAKPAFGVSMSNIRALAKRLGRNHELAAGLWATGWYEARMLATLVDEPDQVTSAQMNRWCREFDNWGIVDTACFALFDRTPHAWSKVTRWSTSRGEFQKRAAFALLACLALHDKHSADQPFLKALPLVEKAASDDRNFVKKGVRWALRAIGGRSAVLNAAAIASARRLASAKDASSRWIGKGALRELTGPAVRKRLARAEAT
jgi:3-methyladenine DNA glycosylase AlkD